MTEGSPTKPVFNGRQTFSVVLTQSPRQTYDTAANQLTSSLTTSTLYVFPEAETYRFTGKPVSQTTGLYYYGARWYDPEIGRFISQDPKLGRLSRPQTLNPYTYVVNSPLNFVDPWGEAECGFWDIGCHAGNVWNAGVNWWNSQDQQTKAAIILTVATIAIVATAGAAAPALIPTLAVGIGIGSGISSAAYVGGTLATGGKITASGLFFAAATGAFLGAVGAVAAPVGGTLAQSIGFKSTSLVAKMFSNSLIAGAAVDVSLAGGEKDPRKLLVHAGFAMIGGGASEALLGRVGIGTVGMNSLPQAARFAPRIPAFMRLSPNAIGVVAGDTAYHAYLEVIDVLESTFGAD